MTTICARCHRELKRQPVIVAGMSMGPRCAAAVAGAKPERMRSADRIDSKSEHLQGDLFAEAASGGTPHQEMMQ